MMLGLLHSLHAGPQTGLLTTLQATPLLRTAEQLLGVGHCSSSASSMTSPPNPVSSHQYRQLHSSSETRRPVVAEPSGKEQGGGMNQSAKFMEPRPAETHPKPPFRRHPIYFPDLPLQILKRLSDQEFKQLKETGWLREVAFKTAPHVTKHEIKGFLESVYGMKVERVHTINYLGKRHQALSKGRMKEYRDDDWKKAYVIFAPPEGMQLPAPPPPERPLEMLHRIRKVQPPRRM
ncbi:hypothetical protein DUNSADRAFT_10816 [Dunaliella salina]|uniref:Large ribosomal subunit protein uL23c n=1 Tax=Dunaliella salina TaxID=3046 RepID=A0ABQ7H9V9_DUNSA|nr:hypothetical protein DUNSADRAFT_10816 [Dunaliella salina]|eukprot:KAF5843641.1 hypothetical protein DUNSADRAFT_10816 [Dunaliella salina]